MADTEKKSSKGHRRVRAGFEPTIQSLGLKGAWPPEPEAHSRPDLSCSTKKAARRRRRIGRLKSPPILRSCSVTATSGAEYLGYVGQHALVVWVLLMNGDI
jgi:hypothetical protein